MDEINQTNTDELIVPASGVVVEQTTITADTPVVDEQVNTVVDSAPIVEAATEVEKTLDPVQEVNVSDVQTSTAGVDVEEKQETKSASLEGVTAMGNLSYMAILDYIEKMHPLKPLDSTVGARYQVALYRTLLTIFNTLDQDFSKVFGSILQLVHEDKTGVFEDINLFRFFETMILPPTDRAAFQRLLNMIKIASDPLARPLVAKQINFEATLSHAITDEGRNKILSFFKV